MAEINLLDSQVHTNVIRARGKLWLLRLVTIIFFALILLYAILFLLGLLTDKKISTAKDQIEQYQASLQNNKQREELLTRQGQLKNANQLLDKHLYWSQLLPELARVTLTSAKYTSIIADSKGGLDLTITTPSYTDAEKYLQVFDLPEYNKQFSNVRVMALAKAQQDNLLQTTLRLKLTLSPSFLRK